MSFLFEENSLDKLTDDIIGKNDFFLTRIGGTDFEALAHKSLSTGAISWAKASFSSRGFSFMHRLRVGQYNGYFDHDTWIAKASQKIRPNSSPSKFDNFLNCLGSSYRDSDAILVGGQPLIDHFQSRKQHWSGEFTNKVVEGKPLYSYGLFDAVTPLVAMLDKLANSGLRFLVVSPFNQSIRRVMKMKKSSTTEGIWPVNAQVITMKTAITYTSLRDKRLANSQTAMKDWDSELDRLKTAVTAHQGCFDVALLSCGSYASPLGAFISNELGRRAIYLGGILNVIFGIDSSRYRIPYYQQLATYPWIPPLEMPEVRQSTNAGLGRPNEALRAYFPPEEV